MRIILIALSFFIATVAYCGLDMETVKKLYADLGIELKTDQKTVEEYDKDLKKYQAEAKKGNAEAIYKIGRMFEAGQGSLKADMKKALTCYEKAASKNNAAAINHLAGMYMTGHGVEADIDKALEFYKRSVELGDSDAMCNLGILNEYGIGFEENYKDALEWYQKSAEKGNVAGMYNTGRIFGMYNVGSVISTYHNELFDIKKAVSWLDKAIEAGSTSAMIEMANHYTYGTVGQKADHKKAFELYMKAAEMDNRTALGKIFNMGLNGKCDFAEAKAVYEKLKEKTSSDEKGTSKYPEYRMLIFNFGEYDVFRKKQPLLGEGFYNKNTDSNVICALYEDGETGHIMERGVSFKTLARWYEKNVEKGDAVSMYQLGMMHRNLILFSEYEEQEQKKNYDVSNEKAIPLFEKAAEQGHAASMFQLGEIYRFREKVADQYEKDPAKVKEMVKKNKALASEWYRKAAAKGHKRAKKALEDIKNNKQKL